MDLLQALKNYPKQFTDSDNFKCPASQDNIWDKIAAVEDILNDHDFDISFNLYRLHEDKVYTKVITSDKTVSINRLTPSVTICAQSQTNRPRNHETSYSLLLSMEKNKQMHCAIMLDVGQFIYFNEETFYNDKTPDEIANILNIDRNCLTGETFGKNGKLKVFT